MHQIQLKTGLGKSTIGRINKEVDLDKENNRGGCPSKLSCRNKQSIIRQITTGKLDNAVQATNFINNIISSPVTPQTVRNSLKENNFRSVVKQNTLSLKRPINCYDFGWFRLYSRDQQQSVPYAQAFVQGAEPKNINWNAPSQLSRV